MYIDNPQNAPQRYPASTLTTGFTIPTALDCVIEYLAFCNTDSSDQTVSVVDGNGLNFLALEPIAANKMTDIHLPEGGLFFRKGFQWKGSVGSKIDAWVRFRHV